MARKKDPAREAERREQMMATCYRLLATRSHHAMTLEAVAKELGGSKGQIAHYYPTKEALISATMRGALELYGQLLLAVATEEAPLRTRLKHLIAAALPDAELLRERIAFVAEVWSFAKTSPETREAVRAAHAGVYEVTRKLLDLGIEEGFVTAKNARALLLPISAMFDGLAVHAAHSDLDVEELRRHAEKTLELLLGLGGKSRV
ncbi:MAG: TetR family transcriptional regulator C-terminal domain-containing protein [Myxococcaceae bacterium]|nr:TetR family transcriptional regulator C-terminal domain-containing protein [Myxococcaceae bacterium]